MYLTDPIADMLNRIRNAIQAQEVSVDIPASAVKAEIARILKSEGFVAKYELLTKRNRKIIRVTIKYRPDKKSVITTLKRVSTPGRHIYVDKNSIPKILRGFGVAILSTPKGILTDAEARKLKVGGEVLCYVW